VRSPIRRPRHATIVAYLALFVALGGTGYAAINLPNNSIGAKHIKRGAVASKQVRNNTIRTQDVRNNTLRTRDVRNGTLRGRDLHANALGTREINEDKLGLVPEAANARTLAGLTPDQLKIACPAGTAPSGDTCIETIYRPGLSHGQANRTCTLAGRRLPTFLELTAYLDFDRPVAPGGEHTANVAESPDVPGQVNALVILTTTGSSVEFIDANGSEARGFRCVATPTN
jgi:hypothetical protein